MSNVEQLKYSREHLTDLVLLLRSGDYPGGVTDWTLHLAFVAEQLRYSLADLGETWAELTTPSDSEGWNEG